jgi:hypothetical protein
MVLVAVLAIGAALGSCKNGTGPEDRAPVLISVTVFPTSIGQNDSALVVCNAYDPDADVLVYDWVTDGRLRLQGALPGAHDEYNTSSNSIRVYPNRVSSPIDTAWVQCTARDGRGMSATKVVTVIVHQ